jgi:hypothetical protein
VHQNVEMLDSVMPAKLEGLTADHRRDGKRIRPAVKPEDFVCVCDRYWRPLLLRW